MIDLEKEREDFEKSLAKKGIELRFIHIVFDDGVYRFSDKFNDQSDFHKDALHEIECGWESWKERAELSQQKIESLSSKHGSTIGKLHFTERKLGEAQQEISHLRNANHHLNEINEDISNTILCLREKLAKYESGEFVLVRRVISGSTRYHIDNLIQANTSISDEGVNWMDSLPDMIIEAMIEAVEKDHE